MGRGLISTFLLQAVYYKANVDNSHVPHPNNMRNMEWKTSVWSPHLVVLKGYAVQMVVAIIQLPRYSSRYVPDECTL